MGKMNEDPLRPGSANLVFFIGRAAIGFIGRAAIGA
jgi:hypothetical protein